MKSAVRYYSRSGNTRLVAEAIAKGAGTQAVPVDAADAEVREPVDVLFIGGALYAYGIDTNLKEYIRSLKKENVAKAVVFSTSWVSAAKPTRMPLKPNSARMEPKMSAVRSSSKIMRSPVFLILRSGTETGR